MSKTWKAGEPDFWEEVQAATARSKALHDGKKDELPIRWPEEKSHAIPSGYTGQPVKMITCHKPPSQDVGHHIYCAASMDLQRAIDDIQPRLIIDCRNLSTTQLTFVPAVEVGQGPRSLRRVVARNLPPAPSIVRIAWPDYKLPPVDARFFVDVARWLAGRPVLCVCMGGHGRSGTAAASLLAAYGVGGSEAIAQVRSKHCRSAIESKAQEGFVKLVADVRKKGR